MDRLESTGVHDPAAAAEPFEETVVGGEEYERVLEPHPAGTKVGRYVILERVGHGGMGVVYSAFDPELNRRVALKILHAVQALRGPKQGATRHGGPPRQRLLREAQAIARVSHPNVISVFDVGTLGDSVFVAMEFVDGPTLTRWQAERSDVAEIVEMYAQAGRGLAAAHVAGIVHRDFKPDNVLIGADGHARVLDFGLARADTTSSFAAVPITGVLGEVAEADTAAEPDASAVAIDLGRSDVLDSPLTMEGAVVGTPRFMAPEQHAGVAADARSDQFSFCVALYQALYRQEPFAAPNLERLALAKQSGSVRRPPSDARVPAHVEAAILRGLSADPAARWPDMRALVAAVTFDAAASRRRRWLVVGTGALVVAAATAGGWLARNDGASQCASAEQLVDVWDDARREELRALFGTIDVPYAAQVEQRTVAALDAYAEQWSASYDDACRAHRRGEQSTELFDRRVQCLAQRRQGLTALVEVLVHADAGVVERAGQAAAGLASIDPCGDPTFLLAAIEPPPPALHAEVEAVREQLAEVQALAAAGRIKPALDRVRETVGAADALDYAPLRAEARHRLGVLLEAVGEYEAAQEELFGALRLATVARHDEVAGAAAMDLASVVGDRLSRHAEGLRWTGLAASLLERVGLGGLTQARLDTIEGNIRYRMGDLAAAQASYERALATTERLRGPDDPAVAVRLANLGNVHYRARRRELTLATFERAVAIDEAAYGPSHPATAMAYFGLANALTALERWDEAERRLEAARAVYREAFGDRHPGTIGCVCNLGVVEEGRGRRDRAIERFTECSRLTALAVGREHPDFAMSLYNLGRLHRDDGAFALAKGELEEAVAIRRRVLGEEHRETLDARAALAELARVSGDAALASTEYDGVIAAMERIDADAVELAKARFGYARAAWVARGPSDAARRRAEQARDAFAADGEPSAAARAEVEAWLRAESGADGRRGDAG